MTLEEKEAKKLADIERRKKRYDKRFGSQKRYRESLPKKPRGKKSQHGLIQPDGTVFVSSKPMVPKGHDDSKPSYGLYGSHPKKYSARPKRRAMLLAYLSNPENEWPKSRRDYVQYMGLTSRPKYLYQVFTADEIVQIETEALASRRRFYAPLHYNVDQALYNNIIENGKAPEVKLWYEKNEGWSPKTPPPPSMSPVIVFPIAPPKSIEEWQNFITANNLKENTLLTQNANPEKKEETVIDIVS